MGVDWGIPVIKDEFYSGLMRIVYQYAWEKSMDPRTKTAAMILSPDKTKILGMGTNIVRPGLSYGVDYTEKDLRDSVWKKANMIHSEDDARNKAKANQPDLSGAIELMYWVPCDDCSKIIIDEKIGTYITHKPFLDRTPSRWVDSCLQGVANLRKKGVKIYMLDDKLGGVYARMNDETFEP